MSDHDRKQSITFSVGAVTWLLDFKASFECVMSDGFKRVKCVLDSDVFAQFGFHVSESEENVCKSCKQLARGGKNRCCTNYQPNCRGKKLVIHNMLMKDHVEV